jgi:succinate dehydrogenase / fumarate reductase flavoprotein subunit
MSTRTFEHDVVIVGGGGAGLRAAIAANEEGADVAIVTKLHPVRSHTGAAEGGINAVLRDGDEVEMHVEDTMKGSDYLADAPAVETLCRESPKETIQLENWGMPFSREEDKRVSQRPFGGLSFPRTTYAGAETGHHLLHVLYEQVVKRGITVYDEWYVTRLVTTPETDPGERTCHGVVAIEVATGDLGAFVSRDGVILATGGLGQVYSHTTNAVANTGDGYAMAYRVGVPLEDMEFVQFHPTTLPATGVLISEGVRGEGGILYNSKGERFMFEYGYAVNAGELASRDVVSRAELTEINEGRGVDDDYVHLDMRHLGEERILDRLENIVHLAEDFQGVNPLEEPMPVKPGQHYQMGGIETNEYGQTMIEGLYAVGETACASVHGANRLGGNALPELIVLGKMAGKHAAGADLSAAKIPVGRTDSSEDGVLDIGIDLGSRDSVEMNQIAVRSNALSPRELVDIAVETERERIEELMSRDTGGN